MFRTCRAHNQEREIVSIQPLVTVILCWWPRCVQVGRRLTWSFTKNHYMMHGKQNVKFYSRGIGNERYVVINTNNLRESAY